MVLCHATGACCFGRLEIFAFALDLDATAAAPKSAGCSLSKGLLAIVVHSAYCSNTLQTRVYWADFCLCFVVHPDACKSIVTLEYLASLTFEAGMPAVTLAI